MAMVTAVRGQRVVKVSRKAYETLFKNKGYRLLGDEQEQTKTLFDDVLDFEETKQEEQEEKTEVETVPISDMNKEQLAEYAKEHNIDTSSARNVREARQIIQKAIREEKM